MIYDFKKTFPPAKKKKNTYTKLYWIFFMNFPLNIDIVNNKSFFLNESFVKAWVRRLQYV